jgi:hypothetical protein
MKKDLVNVIFEITFMPSDGYYSPFGISIMKKTGILLIASVLLILTACKRDPFRVNVSAIKVDLVVSRFEMELFTADPSALENYIPKWKKEYGDFFRHFSYILKLGSIDDPEYSERLRQFVTDQSNYRIYKLTRQVFPDLDTFTSELTDAFRHYRYYFPDKPVPRVITYVSGFNQSAITDDSLLAVGLDKYLGKDENLYRQIGVYNYLLVNMHPQKLVSDCMLFWGETEFPFNDSINNLIANMIYRGRLLYFTHAVLPDQPDTLNWGFTQKGLDYFKSSEKAMWAYLVQHKLLFNTDRFTIDKFILEGPFTKDFGRDSPSRSAIWIGYRIVQSYMQRNRNITLPELMEEKNYLTILNLSAYNP